MYFDTHAHYDHDWFDEDREELLKSMPEAGVSLIVVPGCDRESSETAISLSERFSFVYAAAGWHPHDASKMESDGESFLQNSAGKIVAIGEIGLDYHYDYSPRETQRDVFSRQMALSIEMNLPVIIHDREAHGDCMEIVRRYAGARGVFHCYSGSEEMAAEILKLGYFISFAGPVTFKNARRSLEVVKALPMERILIETDAPYLTPEPFRGKRCDSTHVQYTAKAIAEAKGVDIGELAEITMANGKRLFGI